MTSVPSGKAKCLQHWRTALLIKVPSERHTQCMSLSVPFALEAVPVTPWATAHRWTVPMAREARNSTIPDVIEPTTGSGSDKLPYILVNQHFTRV